jgi:colicin import membrane protein
VEDSTTFIRKLARAKTLLFEFTPYGGSAVQVRFAVEGLADKLPKLEKACPAGMSAKDQQPVETPKPSAADIELKEKLRKQKEEEVGRREEQKKAELERRKLDEEQRKAAEEYKRRAEAAARPAQQKLIDDWRARIQAKIKSRVVVPPNMEGNPEALFEIVLLPGGTF